MTKRFSTLVFDDSPVTVFGGVPGPVSNLTVAESADGQITVECNLPTTDLDGSALTGLDGVAIFQSREPFDGSETAEELIAAGYEPDIVEVFSGGGRLSGEIDPIAYGVPIYVAVAAFENVA